MAGKEGEYKNITWEQDNGVAILTMNRPERMNAISPALDDELHDALHLAEQDSRVRTIVLTGAGKAFSAGYDISEDEPPGGEPGEGAPGEYRASHILKRWWDIDLKTPRRHLDIMRLAKPVIAAVNGWCLGGGLWYALSADITIASERAVFGQPEVRETQNSTFLLAALAGWKNAHRYALTGDHFDALEALRIGIVNEVVPHDELMDRSIKLAHRIALLPPDAVRLNKAITSYGLEAMGLPAALNTAAMISVIAHASTDSPELDELHRIRDSAGLRASLVHRDAKFAPEPGGPRSEVQDS